MRRPNLRHRVILQQRGDINDFSSDVSGQAWVNVGEFRANIMPLTGRELVNADQVMGRVSHKIMMRYNSCTSGIASNQYRLVTKDCSGCAADRVMNIAYAINVEERNQWWELLCYEVTSGAKQLSV
jgi:SPP1 family predicted phage head-tail adaptor